MFGMGALSSQRKAIAAIIVLVAGFAFGLNFLGQNNYLPEGSEHWTEDWLIRYFSQRRTEPQKDVAVVLVDYPVPRKRWNAADCSGRPGMDGEAYYGC